MKSNKQYLLSSVVAMLLIGCGSSTYTNSDTTNNTDSTTAAQCASLSTILMAMDEKYASQSEDLVLVSSAYEVNFGYKESEDDDEKDEKDDNNEKDERDDDDESKGGIHNQGMACAQCHSFASGATVFSDLHAATKTLGANGYKIQLGGSDVYSTGRGTGNSHLTRFSGGAFTANVIDSAGNIVNSSMANSHDASRLDCNRCHTASGDNGAPGRIINKRISTNITTTTTTTASNPECVPSTSTPTGVTTTVSFSANVMPILTGNCKSCHGSNGRFSVTSVGETYNNIQALKGSAKVSGQYVIDKGSNSVGHGGGSIIPASSAEYKTIQAWISAGATNN